MSHQGKKEAAKARLEADRQRRLLEEPKRAREEAGVRHATAAVRVRLDEGGGATTPLGAGAGRAAGAGRGSQTTASLAPAAAAKPSLAPASPEARPATHSEARSSPFSNRSRFAPETLDFERSTKIGSGDYGCVYASPPACDNLPTGPNVVGKIQSLLYHRREVRAYKFWETIDRDCNFHPRFHGECSTTMTTLPGGCVPREVENHVQVFQMFVMDRVKGRPLRKSGHYLAPSKMQLRRNLPRLVNIMYRLAAMGWQHYDVHGGNVIMCRDGLWRMIDFGLMLPPKSHRRSTEQLSDVHAKKLTWLLTDMRKDIGLVYGKNNADYDYLTMILRPVPPFTMEEFIAAVHEADKLYGSEPSAAHLPTPKDADPGAPPYTYVRDDDVYETTEG